MNTTNFFPARRLSAVVGALAISACNHNLAVFPDGDGTSSSAVAHAGIAREHLEENRVPSSPATTSQQNAVAGELVSAKRTPHLAEKVNYAKAHKIRYVSTLQDGSATEVTGVLFESARPWDGPGPRPIIAIGPGTRGQGDHCAPSAAEEQTLSIKHTKLSVNANYEYLRYQAALETGANVVVTDYVGLGTPGIHTYVNSIEEGHALIDAVRASLNLTNSATDTAVGFAGYSQGGGAAAAAAEQAATYAPELNVVGAFAGAPPASQPDIMEAVDGTLLSHVMAYAINGYSERNPLYQKTIQEHLNDRGKRFLEEAAESCIGDSVLHWGYTSSEDIIKSGIDFVELTARYPVLQQAQDEQKLGTTAPSAPILVMNSVNDDIIPFSQSRQLAVDYCELGGSVQFQAIENPPMLPGSGVGHSAPLIQAYPQGMKFLNDRFHDVTPVSNCGEF